MKVSLNVKRVIMLLSMLLFITLLLYPFCDRSPEDRGEQGQSNKKDFQVKRAAMVQLLSEYWQPCLMCAVISIFHLNTAGDIILMATIHAPSVMVRPSPNPTLWLT